MQKHTFRQGLRVRCCLLVFGLTLCLTSCANASSPASPNSTPQPAQPGYNVFTLVAQEITALQHAFHLGSGQ
jgi:hypothetical protein